MGSLYATDRRLTFPVSAISSDDSSTRHLNVPIGLIDNAWGGSAAEAWVNRKAAGRRARLQRDCWNAGSKLEKDIRPRKIVGCQLHNSRLEKWKMAASKAARAAGKPLPRRPRPPRNPTDRKPPTSRIFTTACCIPQSDMASKGPSGTRANQTRAALTSTENSSRS